MDRKLHIAVLQPELRWQQPIPNMLHLRKVVEQLPAAVQCVVLPENWIGISASDPQLAAHAEQGAQFLQTLARTARVHVVGGSITRPAAGGRLENVSCVMDPQGVTVGCYAKRVLFGEEQDTHRAGAGPLIVQVGAVRVAVLICADLWRHQLVAELAGQAEMVCVCAKTTVTSDAHVAYARGLWHALALTRSMECGLPIAVSDWPSGRHSGRDVDVSVGSAHAAGMRYDTGALHRRRPDDRAPKVPTATAHSSAQRALGPQVHYTSGAACLCDPGRRPDIARVHRSLFRGEPGALIEVVDLDAVERYRTYRRSVGLL